MAETGPLILVIEDEPQIHRFLRATLPGHGYRVIEAMTGEAGLLTAGEKQPDLIILDLGLPDMDGLEVTRRLRQWTATPILVLSARGQEQDKVAVLDLGADDYLTKPFGVAELLARIRVALRHAVRVDGSQESPVFTSGHLRVDLVRQQVFVDDEEIHLTATEYKLLALLVRHAGKVLTHQQLLREVWGPQYSLESHYLRIYMGQLRHKLEKDPTRPRLLRTETGVGYRLLVE